MEITLIVVIVAVIVAVVWISAKQNMKNNPNKAKK
jgi:hypothetical protein